MACGWRIKNKALRKKARRHKHTLLNVRESRSAVQSRDQALTCARAACGYQVNVARFSRTFLRVPQLLSFN